MDLLTTSPLVVGAIGAVSMSVLEVLAERLITLLMTFLIIGSVSIFVVTAFTWLWVKRVVGAGHASPSTVRH